MAISEPNATDVAARGLPRNALTGPGAILRLIREAGPITRAELIERTGLGRSTVSQRVDALVAAGLILAGGEAPSTGGRPPATLTFNHRAGVTLAADLGATHSRVAVADLSGQPLAETTERIAIADGPEKVLTWLEQRFDELLTETNCRDRLRAIGIGVPGPVEFASGSPVNPPIMPGWDGYPIPQRLAQRYDVPILVDNDVNIMALGEHRQAWPETENLLFVKVGTGIGCGIIARHEIYRGADGAAGDIGHIRVSGHDDLVCECGNVGCLEIVAGGRALMRDARERGLDVETSADIIDLVRAHHPDIVHLVRQAGRYLGEVLAGLVNALNPSVIILGGDIAHGHEQLFAGVREIVYQRSTPLATKHLQIVRSALDDRAGVFGASMLATQHVLTPEHVDRHFL